MKETTVNLISSLVAVLCLSSSVFVYAGHAVLVLTKELDVSSQCLEF